MLEINKIYNIDCYEGIKLLEDNSIDFLLTDPPFLISRKTNFHTMKGHRGTSMDFGDWDKNTDILSWLDLIKPKLKENCNIIIFNAWENLGKIAPKIREIGFTPKRTLIYQKLNPAPFNRDRLFVNSMEFMIYATGKKWVFNRRKDKKLEIGIFEYSVQRKTYHTTPKPLGLIKELIEILSNKNQLIVDSFIGSGTTAIAALELNRNFIGFEINQEYHKTACNRIEQPI